MGPDDWRRDGYPAIKSSDSTSLGVRQNVYSIAEALGFLVWAYPDRDAYAILSPEGLPLGEVSTEEVYGSLGSVEDVERLILAAVNPNRKNTKHV